MNFKDKLIINKLFKLAGNQQKILQKLAQAVDPNIDYLKRTWLSAAANSGIQQVMSPEIEHSPGSTQGSVQVGDTYTVYADSIPQNDEIRKKVMSTFKTQIATQKPELNGKVGIIFAPKPAK